MTFSVSLSLFVMRTERGRERGRGRDSDIERTERAFSGYEIVRMRERRRERLIESSNQIVSSGRERGIERGEREVVV
jgi:hypothetical protein